MKPSNEEIIAGLRPLCICKGIRVSTFLKHIRAGVRTVEELKKATGAGTGSCHGERCSSRIRELLLEMEEKMMREGNAD